MVVDDYGHHPTEIAAVIAAARAGIDRRVVVVFQPHRYTRTSQLLREFGSALSAADEVVLTDIYAAGEPPIPGVTLDALADGGARSGARRRARRAGARGPARRRSRAWRGRATSSSRSAPDRSPAPASASSRRFGTAARSRPAAGAGDERQGTGGEELPPRATRARPAQAPEAARAVLLARGPRRCSSSRSSPSRRIGP